MKIVEIITNPPRDEYIDDKSHYFDQATPVAKIRDLYLKKASPVEWSTWYGLFKDQNLVGLLQLSEYIDKWQVELTQIAPAFKSQGYGTFLYDYAVMNDNLTLLSDTQQTADILGGSRGLWERLYTQGRYKVCGYDMTTDTVLPDATPSEVYNQKEDIVWMATPWPKQESINEMLTRVNDRRDRSIVWYGPTICDNSCF